MREMQRYKLHTMNVYKFENLQKVDHSTEELCIDADGDWVKYEDAAARIRELEAEISEMRDRYATFEELAPPDVPRKKFVETCFSAWEKSCELEAEISERRLDYTEDCKRLDAKIAELEALLAAEKLVKEPKDYEHCKF